MTDVVSSAGNVKIVITGDGSNFSAVVADVNRKLEALGVKSKAAGAHMVSSVQAASGSIRILEGDVQNNVRAVERFLVSTLKLGPILQAAFPVVGALAFGGVIAKIGQEVYKFVKQAQDAPRVIGDNFASLGSSMRLANDQLALTNLRLENETAKLEKKPENHLSEALIVAQVNAGKLAETLERVSKAQQEAFKGQSIGYVQQLLGKGRTTDTENNIANFESQIVGRGNDQQAALDAGDSAKAASAKVELERLQRNAIAYATDEIKKRTGTVTGTLGDQLPYASVYGDQRAALAELQGFRASTQLSVANQRLQERNAVDVPANDAAKLSVEKAREAAEAQRKAATELKQQMDQEIADAKQDHTVSLSEEIAYWRSALDAVKGGSQPMLALRAEINNKLGELTQELRKKLQTVQGQRVTLKPEDGGVEQLIQQQIRLRQAMDRVAEAAVKQREAVTISWAEFDAATGKVTRLSAAQVAAAAHTAYYTKMLAQLQDELAFWGSTPGGAAQVAEIQEKVDILNARRPMQMAQDSAATQLNITSPMIGAVDALDQFTRSALDASSAAQQFVGTTLGSLNDQIMRAASGQPTNFSNMGAGVFRDFGGKVLNYGEGQVLSKLGFGGGRKPTGTSGDPIYTRVVGALGGGASGSGSFGSGGISSILSRLFGGSKGNAGGGGDSGGGEGQGVSGVVGALANVIPFLAAGGSVESNLPYIVGERGPELFVPRNAGSVIPQGKFGGGNHTHHYHIDARNSNDPAAVQRAVMKGIRQAAPHIAGMAIAGMVDRGRRRPKSMP